MKEILGIAKKCILVTGGAGYIGSHFVLRALKEGYNVIILDNLSTGHYETVFKLMSLSLSGKIIHASKGDLQKENDIRMLFKKNKIDAVVHFAAFSQVAESVQDPQKYYFNNIFGTLNLLKVMLEFNVKKIVFSSTAATYGEPIYTPIDEKHIQNPINPYGNTKFFIEKIMDDYDRAYGLKSIRLRYFNVIGANEDGIIGEWHEPESHLVPNILNSAIADSKTFKLYGNDYPTKDGTCVRDYINVEDLADAHIKALEYLDKENKSDFFNLGSKFGSTTKEVFDVCESVIGEKIKYDIEERRSGDCAVLVADNQKAKELLGWTPEKTLEQSIKAAYLWHKKQLINTQEECYA